MLTEWAGRPPRRLGPPNASEAGCLEAYAPVAISGDHPRNGGESPRYDWIAIRGLVCDFELDLECVPDGPAHLAFLGGHDRQLPRPPSAPAPAGGANLLGGPTTLLARPDLIDDRATLEAAYNDSAGVTASSKRTAAFLNRELGCD